MSKVSKILKSDIWIHFQKKDAQSAMCRYCHKILKTSGNTTNLRSHFQSIHNSKLPETESELEAEDSTRTSTQEDSAAGSIKRSFLNIASNQTGRKKQNITDAIIFMICADSEPFSIVENMGFRRLMKEVAPLYKVPSASTIKAQILAKYEFLVNKFRIILKDIKYSCITTDVWTETLQVRSFLGITIHFIDGVTPFSGSLGVYELNDHNTAAYIAETLREMLAEWKIDLSKISAIVTDGAANIVKAAELLLGKNRHIICFAHAINLVVDKSIGKTASVLEIIKKVKSIVTWFKHSVVANDELRKLTKLKLIQEVCTRWNSKFYMIERFIELRPFVNQVLNNYVTAPNMITALEFENLNDIKTLLIPFECATKEISGEKYVTASSIIPIKNCIERSLAKLRPKHLPGQELLQALKEEFVNKFQHVEHVHLLSISTILDPRFKKIHFSDPIAVGKAVKFIKDELKILQSQILHQSISDSSDTDSVQSITGDKSFSLWVDHHKIVKEQWGHKEKEDNVGDSEITQYLRAPPIGRIRDNPFDIWKEIENQYPVLTKIAHKYLVIMGTSVPSERLFSQAGNIVTTKRNRLLGSNLHKLIFLNSICKTTKLWQ